MMSLQSENKAPNPGTFGTAAQPGTATSMSQSVAAAAPSPQSSTAQSKPPEATPQTSRAALSYDAPAFMHKNPKRPVEASTAAVDSSKGKSRADATEVCYIPHKQLIANGIAITDEEKLFGDDGIPKPEDVQQRSLGDCYLTAALASIAKTNPQAIRACFMEPDSDGKYKISLFKIAYYIINPREIACEPIGPVIIKVDRFLSPRQKKTGVLWPNILELAYATFLKSGNEFHISFQSGNRRNLMPIDFTGEDKLEQILYSGYEFIAIAAITGQKCYNGQISVPNVVPREVPYLALYPFPHFFRAFVYFKTKKFSEKINDYNERSKQLYQKIKDLLAAGKAVTVSFSKDYVKEKYRERGIFPNHAYSIIETQNIGDYSYIIIRNPWGASPRAIPRVTYLNNPKFKKRFNESGGNPAVLEQIQADQEQLNREHPGEIIMELNDFMRRGLNLGYQE